MFALAAAAWASPAAAEEPPGTHHCVTYAEGDPRMPPRVRAYLEKVPSLRGEHRDPKLPRRVEACTLPRSGTVYRLSTSPAFDGSGVCRFITFPLDPRTVGGGAAWPAGFRPRLDIARMQLATTCPAQDDANYLLAVGMSGGVFRMLQSFWRDATRSPGAFRRTFAGVKVTASTRKSLGKMAQALKAGPGSVRLLSMEFDGDNLHWSGRTAYDIRATSSTTRNLVDGVMLNFWVDIVAGRVVPVAVEDRGT